MRRQTFLLSCIDLKRMPSPDVLSVDASSYAGFSNCDHLLQLQLQLSIVTPVIHLGCSLFDSMRVNVISQTLFLIRCTNWTCTLIRQTSPYFRVNIKYFVTPCIAPFAPKRLQYNLYMIVRLLIGNRHDPDWHHFLRVTTLLLLFSNNCVDT